MGKLSPLLGVDVDDDVGIGLSNSLISFPVAFCGNDGDDDDDCGGGPDGLRKDPGIDSVVTLEV